MVLRTRFPGEIPNKFATQAFIDEEGRQLALFRTFRNSTNPQAIELNTWLTTPLGPSGWRHDLWVFLVFLVASLTSRCAQPTRACTGKQPERPALTWRFSHIRFILCQCTSTMPRHVDTVSDVLSRYECNGARPPVLGSRHLCMIWRAKLEREILPFKVYTYAGPANTSAKYWTSGNKLHRNIPCPFWRSVFARFAQLLANINYVLQFAKEMPDLWCGGVNVIRVSVGDLEPALLILQYYVIKGYLHKIQVQAATEQVCMLDLQRQATRLNA